MNLLIVGLGISGMAVARYLTHTKEFVPYVIESKQESEIDPVLLKELKELNIRAVFGVTQQLPDEINAVKFSHAVLSPGVAPNGPIATAISANKIELISELEFGLQRTQLTKIVVTGSNGKSSVTSLIAHIINSSGGRAHACGNLGRPVCQILDAGVSTEDILVIEASSYQLELTKSLNVAVGVFINLSENHLERHGSLDEYFKAKARLFSFNNSFAKTAVINVDDAYGKKLSKLAKGRVVEISNPPYFKSKLIGRHNHYNIALAQAACLALGIPSAAIETAIKTFNPLEHRLERFCAHAVINDSKATSVGAALAGFRAVISEYKEETIALMLGGKAKTGSWEPLFNEINNNRKRLSRLICFGGDGEYIAGQARKAGIESKCFPKLETAVEHICASLMPNEIALFSPGCLSFDQFGNFEERGSVFKSQVVKELG